MSYPQSPSDGILTVVASPATKGRLIELAPWGLDGCDFEEDTDDPETAETEKNAVLVKLSS
ncbi:MAG: hypothetical protein GXP62_00515 [Oligoflexia bacterium]|nr:hypothetical protein [Oligoflexia bacterium]